MLVTERLRHGFHDLQTMKLDRNEDTLCNRPTRKDIQRNGSICQPYERSIYERTFMSEPIENYVIPNEPSNHNVNKKRHRTFRQHREPSRIPRTLQHLSNKRRKVGAFDYKCMFSSTPPSSKMLCLFKVRKHKLGLNPLRHFVKLY